MRDNIRYLKKYQASKQVKEILLEAIDKFKHCKQINARFTTYLKERGLSANIIKESFFKIKKLVIFDYICGSYEELFRFRLNNDNNWTEIKNDLLKMNIEELIKNAELKIESEEKDKQILRKAINILKEFETLNFEYDLLKAQRVLEEALNN